MTERVLHCGDGSPFGREVRIVLAEKGLSYGRDETLATQRPVETFSRLNPGLRVPVLEDGGKVFFDTGIILEYLLTAYPDTPPGASEPPLAGTPTRPEHHFQDALVLSVLNQVVETAANIRQLGLNGITAAEAPYLARQAARLGPSLDWLEARATPEGFQPGVFAIADIALICAADFGEMQEIYEIGARPRLAAIRERFGDRPSVRDTSMPG